MQRLDAAIDDDLAGSFVLEREGVVVEERVDAEIGIMGAGETVGSGVEFAGPLSVKGIALGVGTWWSP
jgi:hypothetical protein